MKNNDEKCKNNELNIKTHKNSRNKQDSIFTKLTEMTNSLFKKKQYNYQSPIDIKLNNGQINKNISKQIKKIKLDIDKINSNSHQYTVSNTNKNIKDVPAIDTNINQNRNILRTKTISSISDNDENNIFYKTIETEATSKVDEHIYTNTQRFNFQASPLNNKTKIQRKIQSLEIEFKGERGKRNKPIIDINKPSLNFDKTYILRLLNGK
jgi:hypothetical protein